MDVAGWWAAAGEVREDGQRLGWSEADVETATFAWLEAKRPAIQLLPNVAVPGKHPESEAPTPLQRALPGGAALSTRELVPTVSLVHPGNERYRPPLRKFFFELGEEGLLWKGHQKRQCSPFHPASLHTQVTPHVQRGMVQEPSLQVLLDLATKLESSPSC